MTISTNHTNTNDTNDTLAEKRSLPTPADACESISDGMELKQVVSELSSTMISSDDDSNDYKNDDDDDDDDDFLFENERPAQTVEEEEEAEHRPSNERLLVRIDRNHLKRFDRAIPSLGG